MRMLTALILAIVALSAVPAAADEVACLTSINGERRPLIYDPEEPNVRANISLREKTFGGPKGIECPGFVTLSTILRDMTPEITYAQTEPFCLVYDDQRQTYTGVAVGRRDARLLCKEPGRSLCQRVNDTKEAAMNVASLGHGVVKGVDAVATAAGVSAAVGNASGAVVLSGPAAYLSGAFSSLGASALAVVTAPATLTATAVTVVVVGGAIYACAE
jgi:hypothetical protein